MTAQVSEESLRGAANPNQLRWPVLGGLINLCRHQSCVLHTRHLRHQKSQACSKQVAEQELRTNLQDLPSRDRKRATRRTLGVTRHPSCHIAMKPSEHKDWRRSGVLHTRCLVSASQREQGAPGKTRVRHWDPPVPQLAPVPVL